MPERSRLAWGAFVIVCLVWGTTYLGIRIALETLPPLLLTGARFTVAGTLLLAVCWWRGQRPPARLSELAHIAMIGFLMVAIGNLAVVWAERSVPSGLAALMVALSPFWMVLMEMVRGKEERLNRRQVTGLVVGFAGVLILLLPHLHGASFNLPFVIGILVIQAGSIGWNLGSMRSKYHAATTPPLVSAGLQMLSGGVIVGVVGFAIGEAPHVHYSQRSFAALVYLTLFGSVLAYTAYVYALAHLPTSTVSLYAYVNPAIAVLVGWMIADEELGWRSAIAGVVILAGVFLVEGGRSERVKSEGTKG
jgi:drug/metabolite transporter (DMT)-like permease